MAEMTLKVPAEHWEAFRAGVLTEMAIEGTQRSKDFTERSVEDMYDAPDSLRKGSWADYQDYFPYIGRVADLMAAMVEAVPPPATPEREIGITAHPEAIYHSLHQMMVKFTCPLMTKALDTLPPEPEKAQKWMGATEWALASLPVAEAELTAMKREEVAA